MLGLAIQPPSKVPPGVPLNPPVAARLSTENDIFAELGQIWAGVTLIHKESGETMYDQLGGRVADSAHPRSDASHAGGVQDRAYFYFPDLVIHEPGRYRIRITLMHMDYDSSPNGAVTMSEYTDSHSIVVEEGVSSRARPNAHERAFMRVLRDDGQSIPSH